MVDVPALSALDPARLPATLRHALAAIDRVYVYSIGLPRRFRGIDVREGVLVHGPAGWGEISPFWDYGPAESARWFAAGLEAARSPFPPPGRARIPVNATVPVCAPRHAYDLVKDAEGVRTVKVKVAEPGVPLDADAERLAAVRDALGPEGSIRVDANAAWGVDEAETAIERLARAAGGLEYVEQPCARVAELARLRPRVGVPIAADESVRRAADPLAVVRAGACDLIVTKVQPLGGVTAALDLARRAGVPVVVSSAIDTSVGLSAAVHLAAALPDLPYACGLGTRSLLAGDIVTEPLDVVRGGIDVRRVEVRDPRDFPQVDPARVAAWVARLTEIADAQAAPRMGAS